MAKKAEMSEEEERVVSILREPYLVSKACEQKKREIAHFSRMAYAVPGQKKREGGKAARGQHAPFEAWINAKVDAEEELKGLETELRESIQKALRLISTVSDGRYREVLEQRHLFYCEWNEIAEDLDVSRSTLNSWHWKGIREIVRTLSAEEDGTEQRAAGEDAGGKNGGGEAAEKRAETKMSGECEKSIEIDSGPF